MLGFSRKQNPASDLGTGLFGKVLSASDFLSLGEYSPASGHLNKWLEEGVGWAATQAKDEWSTLGALGPRAFIFRPEEVDSSDRVVVGLVQPSRDAVGRRFPLAVYSELSLGADVENYPVIPLAAGDFLENAQGILSAADEGNDPRPKMLQTAPSISQKFPSAKEEFDSWAKNTSTGVVWTSLFGADALARAKATMANLLIGLEPFRKQSNPSTPLALRLPLGGAGVAGAVFWLEVIRRCSDWRRRVPCAFWHSYVGAGAITIPLGNPSPRILLGLWISDDQDDSLCDLTGDVNAFGELSPSVELSMGEQATVFDFLTSIRR